MRHHPLSLFASVFLFSVALFPRSALAQAAPSVTGIEGTVQRCEPASGAACVSADGAGGNPHPAGVLPNDVDFEDCSADLYYELPLGIADLSTSYSLEAWVGPSDCSQLANRQSAGTSVCWPVVPFQVATVNPFRLDVRLRDIASGAFSVTHPVTYTPSLTPDVCQEQLQTAPTSLTLYVFFVDGGSNPVGTVQEYPITLDLRAGDVPGPISVEPASDGALVVDVAPATDPDTLRYNVYCDPPPPAQGAADAGADGSAGASTSAAACAPSSVLSPNTATEVSTGDGGIVGDASTGIAITGGVMTLIDPKYICATAPANVSSIDVTSLTPGEHYNVAVGAVDPFGNVGPISNLVCATPGSDIAGASSASGAGGASCSVARTGEPAGSTGLAVAVFGILVASARKRRRDGRISDARRAGRP